GPAVDVGPATGDGGLDVLPGCVALDERAEVGEARVAVLVGRGRGRVDTLGARRGDVGGVLGLVARGDRGEDAAVDQTGRRLVERRVLAAAQGHVGHGRAAGVGRDPVHALDDPGRAAAAVVA